MAEASRQSNHIGPIPAAGLFRCPREPTAFLAHDPSVLELENPVGEGNGPRIVRQDKHAVRAIPSNVCQERHDGPAVFAVQRAGRLVREDG
jgi:hypothetical protein